MKNREEIKTEDEELIILSTFLLWDGNASLGGGQQGTETEVEID
jgi:hypothetical protein